MAEFDPSENTGTIPVQEKHQFDLGNLQHFMEANVDDFSGKLTVEEFAGGQSNPTYLLSAGTRQYVMRRKPPGVLLKSAHAIDREYRVIRALENTNVPTAKAFALSSSSIPPFTANPTYALAGAWSNHGFLSATEPTANATSNSFTSALSPNIDDNAITRGSSGETC